MSKSKNKQRASGKGFGKKPEARFVVEILSANVNSHINVKVIDRKTSAESTNRYHLFVDNGKAYAEAVFDSAADFEKADWIGKNINQISKLICAEFLRDVRLLIINHE